LKSRAGIIIGLIILGVMAISSVYIAWNINNVSVTIETDGLDVAVKTSSLFGTPEQMNDEMQQKVLEQIVEPNSTVESIGNDIKTIARKYNYSATVTIVSQFGTNQLPMPATVRGRSMVPTLQDGQEIIALKTTDYKVDDIVVATHPDHGMIVKRLKKIEGNRVYLMSDNRNVEYFTTERDLGNGLVEIYTYKRVPLDTWLPRENIVGVVKSY
jgi:phage repressor protein C with HTH and peptisase S24 domain